MGSREMDTILVMFMLVLVLATTTFGENREDGLCGPGHRAPSGQEATCEHIPPFPTCCQKNGHCGWDCDDVSAPVRDVPRPAVAQPVRVAPAPKPIFSSSGLFRPDGKCGPLHPVEDGTAAECDPNSEYFCCSKHGYCGPGPEHCACPGCVDYRSGEAKTVELFVGSVRADRRCGAEFPLPEGGPSQCDGGSDKPCCSKWGYCGPGDSHCGCPTCVDYRTEDQKLNAEVLKWEGTWRNDRRCGPEFPLPDGSGPGECNPNSDKFCCSKWGFCGGDGDHCAVMSVLTIKTNRLCLS